MKTLVIETPYGRTYRVNAQGQLIRTDMEFTPSDSWRFLGIKHVKRNEYHVFAELTQSKIDSLDMTYKNGNPQYTVCDMDHGTKREWGNAQYHGIKRMYWQENCKEGGK